MVQAFRWYVQHPSEEESSEEVKMMKEFLGSIAQEVCTQWADRMPLWYNE